MLDFIISFGVKRRKTDGEPIATAHSLVNGSVSVNGDDGFKIPLAKSANKKAEFESPYSHFRIDTEILTHSAFERTFTKDPSG